MEIDRQITAINRALQQDPGQFQHMLALAQLWHRSSMLIDDRSLQEWLDDLQGSYIDALRAKPVLRKIGHAAIPGLVTAFERGSHVAQDILKDSGISGIAAFKEILRNPKRRRAYDAHRLIRDFLDDEQEILELALDLVRTNDRLRRTLAFMLLEEVGSGVIVHIDELATHIDDSSPFEVSWLFRLIQPHLEANSLSAISQLTCFAKSPVMRRTFAEVGLSRLIPALANIPLEVSQVFLEVCPFPKWAECFQDFETLNQEIAEINLRGPEILERRIRSDKLNSFDLFIQLQQYQEQGRRVLLRLLKSDNAWLRDAAVKELGQLPHCEETIAALEDALNDESFLVRDQAREVLNRLSHRAK